MCPTLYEECVGSLTSHRFITCARAYETGPTVYHPHPRRLESQTQLIICWEAPARVPIPYLFMYHWYPYHDIPSIDNNGPPFTY